MSMKGNIAGLMQQAQKMQQEMQKAQEELARMEVTGQAGGGMVSVVMNGEQYTLSNPRFITDNTLVQTENRIRTRHSSTREATRL